MRLNCNFSWDLISFIDCYQASLISDGYCNDDTNIVECGYDGGDCCGSCINTEYCTNCSCIGNVIGNGVPNALLGDGYCNDETNNVHCYYDGLDCCQSSSNTEVCSECSCHGEMMIMQIYFSFLIRAKPNWKCNLCFLCTFKKNVI